ncbi:ArgE/DapE family deacylase [candidate division KSB1 bacterium]|nr:ArgE/DapE family deacylase [candidate division KSB1 bacterium]
MNTNDARHGIRTYYKDNYIEIREKIIRLVTEMVKEQTINVISEKLPEFPHLKMRGEEYRVANIVKRDFAQFDIPYHEFARMEGRSNIIGKLGSNTNGIRLLVPAHMDVVPAGEGWDHDPFEVVLKNDRLYGRGTNDNKGPLAALIMAAAILKDLDLDQLFKGQLLIAALSDEEATDPDGIDYGIGYLLEKRLIDPTHAIIPDIGGDMQEIDIAEKGRIIVKITATGQQAHGSTPEKGINAILMMTKLINQIETLELPHEFHPILGKPTINLGEIHGGVSPNVVPGSCHIYLDIRTVPGMKRASIIKELHSCFGKIEKANFKIDVISETIPFSVDQHNVLVKTIQQNTEEILNIQPKPLGICGGTYAKDLIRHDVLTVGWGPGGDTAHIANEYIEVKQLVDFSLLISLIALDLLA